MDSLLNFLRDKRLDKKHNVHGQGAYAGNYFIPDDKYEQFISLVHKSKPYNDSLSNILEKHGEIVQFSMKLSFLYKVTENVHCRFSLDDIRHFILLCSNSLYEYFDFTELGGKNLRFFILLNSVPSVRYCVKTGLAKQRDTIQIICPDLIIEKSTNEFIRNTILDQNLINKVFIHTGFINSESDVYDLTSVNRLYSPLYGCGKINYTVCALYEIPSTLVLPLDDTEEILATLDDELKFVDCSIYDELAYMKLFSVPFQQMEEAHTSAGKEWSEDEIAQLLKNIKEKRSVSEIHKRPNEEIHNKLKELAYDYYYNDERSIEHIQRITGLTRKIILEVIRKDSANLTDIVTVLTNIQQSLNLLVPKQALASLKQKISAKK